jgi:hypothetical protein
MTRRWFLVILLALPLILSACRDEDTTLSFNNKTECGMAAITITNTDTGNLSEYSLDEGEELVVDIEHGITYRYQIEYSGRPGTDFECEPKSGSVLVPKRGQDSTFNLTSATATPAIGEADTSARQHSPA